MPCYNEANTIGSVLGLLLKTDFGVPFEIIVVNDGSTDESAGITRSFAGNEKRIRFIDNKNNRGKGFAVRQGIAAARGSIVVIQDADLEYDPRQIKKLLVPILNGDSVAVFGSRFLGKISGMGFGSWFGNVFLSKITSLLFGSRLTDVETCYKAIDSSVAKHLNLKQDRFEIELEIAAELLKKGVKIMELPIHYSARRKLQGKKITPVDGVKALLFVLKKRFSG